LTAVLLLGSAFPAQVQGNSAGVLRFFEEPGPPPPAGSPDPLLGQCIADVAGLEPLGTQRCEARSGLESVYDVELSPDGHNLYTAAAISDAISVFARDPAGRLQPSGCIAETTVEGCTDGRALDGAIAAAASPDGKNVYVTARTSDAVAVFSRNAATGALTQLLGTSGCVSETGAGGCGVARGLDHALGIEVSADGRHVYTAGRGSDAIAIFSRNASTGALSQLAGGAGCLHDSVTSTSGLQGCTDARGLDGAYSMTLSADGGSAYVASRVSDAAAGFRRNPDGTLTQVAGPGGCVSYAVLPDCRPAGRAFDGATDVAVSPDGSSAYVASYGGDAVSILSRNTATGALAPAGCLAQDGTSPECGAARALDYANAVEVDERGRNVYVAAGYADAIAVFERAPDGSLTQEPPAPGRTWADGCLSWRGHKWAEGGTDLGQADHSDHYCARALALYYPYALELGPGGSELYVASTESDTVSMYRRLDTRGYVRPAGAARSRLALVPAFRRCVAPDRMHGPPLDSPSCSQPRLVSTRLTFGAGATGFVSLKARAGDPVTSSDEADVSVRVDLKSVQQTGDASAYEGPLEAAIDVRLTDAQPFGGAIEPLTTADIQYRVPLSCAGGRCSVSTSADALVPDTVRERWRTVWQLGQARILDGDEVLAVQGVFVP
jgi:6-phosphogluconolactonase (cycloisomerase 2 family)